MDYKKYSDYLSDNIAYSEYIAEQMDKSISYSEHIAEQIKTNVPYDKSKEVRELREKKIKRIYGNG